MMVTLIRPSSVPTILLLYLKSYTLNTVQLSQGGGPPKAFPGLLEGLEHFRGYGLLGFRV